MMAPRTSISASSGLQVSTRQSGLTRAVSTTVRQGRMQVDQLGVTVAQGVVETAKKERGSI